MLYCLSFWIISTLYDRVWDTQQPIRWTRNRPPDTLFNISLNQCLLALENYNFQHSLYFEVPLIDQSFNWNCRSQSLANSSHHHTQSMRTIALLFTWSDASTFSLSLIAWPCTILEENAISTLIMSHRSAILLTDHCTLPPQTETATTTQMSRDYMVHCWWLECRWQALLAF